MNSQPPPTQQPPQWVWPRWFSVYLILMSATVAVAICLSAIPGGRRSIEKALGLTAVAIFLDILGAIGIAMAVNRRSFWRGETDLHWLIAIVLFLLGTTAFGIFVFVGCMAASNY